MASHYSLTATVVIADHDVTDVYLIVKNVGPLFPLSVCPLLRPDTQAAGVALRRAPGRAQSADGRRSEQPGRSRAVRAHRSGVKGARGSGWRDGFVFHHGVNLRPQFRTVDVAVR